MLVYQRVKAGIGPNWYPKMARLHLHLPRTRPRERHLCRSPACWSPRPSTSGWSLAVFTRDTKLDFSQNPDNCPCLGRKWSPIDAILDVGPEISKDDGFSEPCSLGFSRYGCITSPYKPHWWMLRAHILERAPQFDLHQHLDGIKPY